MKNLSSIIENIDQLTYVLNDLRKNVLELSKNPPVGTDSTLQREEILRLMMNSANWPDAIPHDSICNTEADKQDRAEGILELLQIFGIDIKDKKCLDYGCGDGHLVKAMKEASLAVGYDLDRDWDEIADNTYDVVVLYDVLDHAEKENPVDILRKIGSVVHENSVIFIRFHPWCGPHGAHLYRTINKANVQLFFTKDELKEMGCALMPTTEIIYPVRTYKQWIKDAGFKILDNEVHRVNTPQIFTVDPLYSKLEKIWGNKNTFEQLSIEFADVVISPA